MTYRELLRTAASQLSGCGIEEAQTDAWELLSYALKIDRTHYFLVSSDEVPDEDAAKYLALIQKRAEHIPLQHLTGVQEFMGLTFAVDENVLIPRQDTEVLAELAISLLKGKNASALDLCTGSGCLAVALQSFCPEANVAAADISEKALAVARKNAERNQCPQIAFYQSDLMDAVPGRFDLIVSNPPYIPTDEIAELMPEVRDHEPRLALDGSGDGLYFYRRIVDEAPEHLKEGGWLLFEIGWDQGPAVADLMEKRGFSEVTVKKDLAGLDRVVSGLWP